MLLRKNTLQDNPPYLRDLSVAESRNINGKKEVKSIWNEKIEKEQEAERLKKEKEEQIRKQKLEEYEKALYQQLKGRYGNKKE